MTNRPHFEITFCGALDLFASIENILSIASQQGEDGMFMVCSKKCAGQLKKALEEEVALGKFFAGVENG